MGRKPTTNAQTRAIFCIYIFPLLLGIKKRVKENEHHKKNNYECTNKRDMYMYLHLSTIWYIKKKSETANTRRKTTKNTQTGGLYGSNQVKRDISPFHLTLIFYMGIFSE